MKRVMLLRRTRLYLRRKGVIFGRNLDSATCPFVRRDPAAVIILGEGVTIRNALEENPAGITHKCALVACEPGARLEVGDHVGMSGVVLHCAREIVIEAYVNLGAGVKVYDTDFHPLGWRERRIHDKKCIRTAPVRICEDVWIGAGATILRGVTIGARSIVGAGAVVTRSIPPDSVAVGVPARVIQSLPNVPLRRADVVDRIDAEREDAEANTRTGLIANIR